MIPARTRKRTSDVVHTRAPPPPSISRAHVDYNYPQVITTHTTVFQWALTAIWPLYSAKLVFPFPVEENRTEIAKGRDRDRDRKKEETSGDRWLILDSTSPTLNPLFYRNPLIPAYRHPRTCLFLQFARRPTIRFLGSFGYRISVRLRRSSLDPGRPKRPANAFPGNDREDHLHLPRIIPLSLISFPLRPNELNMHGAFIYYL